MKEGRRGVYQGRKEGRREQKKGKEGRKAGGKEGRNVLCHFVFAIAVLATRIFFAHLRTIRSIRKKNDKNDKKR